MEVLFNGVLQDLTNWHALVQTGGSLSISVLQKFILFFVTYFDETETHVYLHLIIWHGFDEIERK